jgi:hypothetical protein
VLKHFVVVALMAMFASIALRLWVANAPVSAHAAGING